MNKINVKVLYNSCYGGFSPSKKALELYYNRKKENDPSYEKECIIECIKRHDPILVQIYHELGNDFDEEYSKTKVKIIHHEYENYYDIHEYDGKETIYIDYNSYKLDKIKDILQNNTTSDEKIIELNKFF